MRIDNHSKNLQQIENYDETILELLLSNKKLLKLIKYTDKDPLSKEDVIGKDMIQIKNENFFDTPIIPTQDTQKTIISYYFDDFKPNNTNNFYKDSYLIINIFMYNELVKIINGNRMYKIMNLIDSLLSDNRHFGIGRLNLIDAHWVHYYPNSSIDFIHFQFVYKIIDLK